MPMFKLAISAGHYLGTPGKRCAKSLDPNETREWVLNDRIADKFEKILAEYDGIETLRVDDTTGKKNISLEERARIANNWKADLYVAIHHNAADLEEPEDTFDGGGIVVYIHSTNAKPGATEWQKAFYDASVKHTGLKGNRATPLAKAKLKECGLPNCVSVLVECGFMNSTVDVPKILSEAFADNMAKALAETVIEKIGATMKNSVAALMIAVTLPVLKKGSKGEEVKTLQRILNALGYTDANEKALTVDGSFGPATLYALKAYQNANGLEVDGYCGKQTWKSLLT